MNLLLVASAADRSSAGAVPGGQDIACDDELRPVKEGMVPAAACVRCAGAKDGRGELVYAATGAASLLNPPRTKFV
jgi:hypothetical protein